MRKMRSAVLILGGILLCLVASVATFFGLSAAGALAEDPINLTYTIENNTKTYDGEPLVAENYSLTEGTLLAGHEAVVTFVGSQINAGESESNLQVTILDEDGYDVTNKYAIKVNSGLLKVNPLDVSIKLEDTEVIYDGQRINCNNYTLTEGYLIPGHEFRPSVSVELVNVNDELPSDIEPFVFDAKGNDVTSNYNIDLTFGNIKILPRPLIVKPVEMEKQYDGKELVCNNYEIISGSLVAGHFIEATYKTEDGNEASLTEVGVENVKINTLKIYTQVNGEKVDVTQNYELSYSTLSKLQVKPYEVTVSLNNISKVYDGESILNELKDAYDVILTHNALPNGYAFGFTKEKWDAYWEEYVEAQKVLYKDVPFDIYDADYNNVTNNFTIVQIPATLEITQVTDVVVVLNSYSKTYNGEAITLSPSSAINLKDSTSLPSGFAYEFSKWIDYTQEFVDAGRYEYSAVFKIVKDGKDLTDKFNVTVVPGEVIIEKADLTIKAPSKTKEYDGEILTNFRESPYSSNDIKNDITGTLYGSDAFTLNYEGALTDVGTASNIIIDLKFTTGKESNYNIKLVDGILKVTEKSVSLTFNQNKYSKTYDGTALSLSVEDFTLEGLITDHKIVNVVHTQVVNVNNQTADGRVLSLQIVDAKTNVDVTKNYKIDLSKTTDFEIVARNITISTATINKAYDGQETYDSKGYDLNNKLVSGHDIKVKQGFAIPKLVNVDSIENRIEYEIFDNDGNNVTTNYNISYQYGTLTITKARIDITLEDLTKDYTGVAYKNEDIVWNDNLSAPGHSLMIINSNISEIIYPGTKELKATFAVRNANGENKTENFNIYVNSSTMTINKIGAMLQFADGYGNLYKIYDGKPLEIDVNTLELIGNNNRSVLLSGHRIKDATYTKIINSDDANKEFIIYNVVIVDSNGKDVTDYYNIDYSEVKPERIGIDVRKISVSVDDIVVNYDPSMEMNIEDYLYNKINSISYAITSPLADGDTIDEVEFSISKYNEAKNTVEIEFDFVIFDRNGYDVWDYECDDVTVNVIINKYNQTIVLDSFSFDYDGYDYYKDEIENISIDDAILNSGNIESGLLDALDLDINYGKINGAGTYSYFVTYDEYVSKYYSLNIIPGTIMVNKQDAYIVLKSKTVEYDSEREYMDSITDFYDIDNVIVSTNLSDEDLNDISLPNIGSLNISGVGVYSYYLNIDSELYKNYNITVSQGTIEVTKRKLSVSVNNYYYEYDSDLEFKDKIDALDAETVIIGYNNLTPEEQDLFEIKRPNVTKAGKYSLEITIRNISATDNYEISVNPGTIEVYKNDLVINLKTFTFQYDEDGNYREYDDPADVVIGFNRLEQDVQDALTVNWPTLTDAGLYTYSVNANYANDNYNITIQDGVINIVKQTYNIYLKEYNVSYDANGNYPSLDSLSEANVIMGYYSLPDEISAVINGVNIPNITNAGIYNYELIISNANLKNYDLVIGSGKIVVGKKDVYISLKDFEFEYSNDGSTYEEYTDPADVVVSYNSLADEIQNLLNRVNWPNLSGVETHSYDITVASNDNYNIIVNPGVVRITKKQVNVVLNNYSFEYDGDAHVYDIDIDACVLGELPDDIYVKSLVYSNNMTNVGVYSYTVKFAGNTNNYNINVYPGTVEIYSTNSGKQTITISLATINAAYTGDYVDVATEYDATDLILNQELLPDDVDASDFTLSATRYIEKGTYTYTLVVPNSVLQKYNVQVNPGTLIIA